MGVVDGVDGVCVCVRGLGEDFDEFGLGCCCVRCDVVEVECVDCLVECLGDFVLVR